MHFLRRLSPQSWQRIAISLVLLCASIYVIWLQTGVSDFIQDYVAAWGWLRGMDPNQPFVPFLSQCCADANIGLPNQPLQTAHPPFATILAVPFTLVSFTAARWIWLVCSWVAILLAWELGRIRPIVCAVTSLFWVMVLQLGGHEPLLFLLIILALKTQSGSPSIAGALLGCAVALKIYPVVLLGGLLVGRRWRMLLTSIAVVTGVFLVCEVVLGSGVTAGWLAYTPINTAYFLHQGANISLVGVVHKLLSDASPFIISAAFGIVFTLTLLSRLQKGDWTSLVPVMLLISPLSWLYYIGLIAARPLPRTIYIPLAIAGVVLLAGAYGWPLPQWFGGIAVLLMQGALLWLWYITASPRRQLDKAVDSIHVQTEKLPGSSSA